MLWAVAVLEIQYLSRHEFLDFGEQNLCSVEQQSLEQAGLVATLLQHPFCLVGMTDQRSQNHQFLIESLG